MTRIEAMKKNNNHKRPNNRAKPIQIEFAHSTANEVAIGGSFNGGRPERVQHAGKGKWAKELMLAPGTYEYVFVADGRWVPDPRAREAVPNPFGGVNSLLTATE